MTIDNEEISASEAIDRHSHRPVKLVSYTKLDYDYSCEKSLEQNASVQDLIAFCAKVSNPSNQTNMVTADKLVDYLIVNKHWSPFEMASACIEIKTTRDIARQILRHRSFSFQEFSQRYANPVNDLNFVMREARLQDVKNRQNSLDTDDEKLHHSWERRQQLVINIARDAYQWAIDNGIAKEIARAVLPEGLTESKLYVNGTIRSWIHYIEVRSDVSTQKEHRTIALLCAEELARIIPKIIDRTRG